MDRSPPGSLRATGGPRISDQMMALRRFAPLMVDPSSGIPRSAFALAGGIAGGEGGWGEGMGLASGRLVGVISSG